MPPFGLTFVRSSGSLRSSHFVLRYASGVPRLFFSPSDEKCLPSGSLSFALRARCVPRTPYCGTQLGFPGFFFLLRMKNASLRLTFVHSSGSLRSSHFVLRYAAGVPRLFFSPSDEKIAWQRPTLPPKGSTIGAGGLNFRVRHGNGWFPSALVTRLNNFFSP